MNQPLFRPEVITERQTQWLGTVLLAPRLSYRFFTMFAVLATGAVLGLLFATDYARKARINGWLVPQQGLIRVLAPHAGVVTHLYVREGGEVHQGERLLRLSSELQSTALGATQSAIARELTTRRRSLAAEQRQHEQLLVQQKRALRGRLATLQAEQTQMQREIALQESRIRLAEKTEQRYHALRDRGLVGEQQVQQVEEDRIEQLARLHSLERTRMVMQRDRLTLESELQDLPLKAQAQIATIERNIAEISQQLAEAEARREIVVTAPQPGIVTAIQAEAGGSVNTSVPLLSIVPEGTQLEAHLFGPSRAVGFVRPGQHVLLRYRAYPYQKFGHYRGVVATVSRSTVSPSEMPSQLTGLTSLFEANEPVYRIIVSPERQTITAYGQSVPLQPGMQLEADVIIERRRLIEWVLDPLFTLTGKWNG